MSLELKICRHVPPEEWQRAEELFPLCGFRCTFERDFGRNGQIASNGLRSGEIVLRSNSLPAERLIKWIGDRSVKSDGAVIRAEGDEETAEATFYEARPISYNLHYEARAGADSLIETYRIYAGKIVTYNNIVYERKR